MSPLHQNTVEYIFGIVLDYELVPHFSQGSSGWARAKRMEITSHLASPHGMWFPRSRPLDPLEKCWETRGTTRSLELYCTFLSLHATFCLLPFHNNDSYAVYGWDVICLISTLDAPQRCVWVNNFWVKEDFIFMTSIIRTLCSICPFRVRIKEVQLYWLTVSRLQCISCIFLLILQLDFIVLSWWKRRYTCTIDPYQPIYQMNAQNKIHWQESSSKSVLHLAKICWVWSTLYQILCWCTCWWMLMTN